MRMREVIGTLMDGLRGRRFDLVSEVIQPWSIEMMLILSEPDQAEREGLVRIAKRLFYKRGDNPAVSHSGDVGEEQRKAWKALAKEADAELDVMIRERRLSLSKSMFMGLTQTLPSFLAKAWLVLLMHPEQMVRLAKEPELMPGATEELLRYAGVVNTLSRRASRHVRLGEVWVDEGQQIVLRVASANFDPARFGEPERLDITRRQGGHVGLGTGVHACVGAVLVRMVCNTITPVFAEAGVDLDGNLPVVWTQDTALHWPLTVPVRRPEATP
jgi:cytochrome P450